MPDTDDLPSCAPAAAPCAAPQPVVGPVLDIVCLCAAWCGTCRDYEATFAALQSALPGHRYRWIDIEDEADLAGDIDVETFPTLMLAHRGRVLFAGPVLPRLGDAQRLVEVQLQAVAAAPGRIIMPAVPANLPADQAQAYAELAASLAE
ncbi:thioredoxin family protein [Aquabacterium sp.]|uniref:thioredoxin family protein n=1 Tax=Aquabacterium sp. TaxID=1872578 RepID=UPI001DF2B5D3|nr:thioredoxin family protein [Aquabacterium sp.]MBT9609158.1 thioredoxin family protein [Aquabacterium sp.]